MHNLHAPNLFDTAHGSVLHCACCGRVQIAFRGYDLLIDTEAFDALCRTMDTAIERLDGDEAAAWRLKAETAAGTTAIELSTAEIRALHHLLQGTRAMMRLRRSVQAVAAGQTVKAEALLDDDPGTPSALWN